MFEWIIKSISIVKLLHVSKLIQFLSKIKKKHEVQYILSFYMRWLYCLTWFISYLFIFLLHRIERSIRVEWFGWFWYRLFIPDKIIRIKETNISIKNIWNKWSSYIRACMIVRPQLNVMIIISFKPYF